MGDIVNLKRFKKRNDREQSAKQADANRARGEFVLVVHALKPVAADDAEAAHDATLRTLLAELPLKQAVSLAAELTGAARNALYTRALALKAQDGG